MTALAPTVLVWISTPSGYSPMKISIPATATATAAWFRCFGVFCSAPVLKAAASCPALQWPHTPLDRCIHATTCRASRDIIYSALLRSMTPEHKFSSAAKLCGEVLAGVADGLLPLVECEEVLRDALCLLASKDIKVRKLKPFVVLCCIQAGGKSDATFTLC